MHTTEWRSFLRCHAFSIVINSSKKIRLTSRFIMPNLVSVRSFIKKLAKFYNEMHGNGQRLPSSIHWFYKILAGLQAHIFMSLQQILKLIYGGQFLFIWKIWKVVVLCGKGEPRHKFLFHKNCFRIFSEVKLRHPWIIQDSLGQVQRSSAYFGNHWT